MRTSPVTDASHHLALEGDLGIATVAAQAPALLDAAARGGRLALDLGAIVQFDGAGLQLLMMAAREAARAGGELRIEAASRSVAAGLATARLDAALQPAAQPRDCCQAEARA